MNALRLSVLALLMCWLPSVVGAQTSPSIEKMLTNLGLDLKRNSGGSYFQYGDYTIDYNESSDKTRLYFDLGYAVPADKSAKTPLIELLAANVKNVTSFYLYMENGRVASVGLACNLPTSMLSPVALRQELDALVENAKDNQALLNPANWK